MLQNAIANRARNAERQAAYTQAQGKLWGDAVANVGSIIGRGVGGYNAWSGDTTTAEAEDAELEMLKKQVEQYEAQQAEAADYRGQVGTYSRASLYDDNPYKLPGNSNATKSDYMNYLMEMNRPYGGR